MILLFLFFRDSIDFGAVVEYLRPRRRQNFFSKLQHWLLLVLREGNVYLKPAFQVIHIHWMFRFGNTGPFLNAR
jgi:hypothetical protein